MRHRAMKSSDSGDQVKKKNLVAVDMGGTSVKMLSAAFEKDRLVIKDDYSFTNEPVTIMNNMYLNIWNTIQNIETGLLKFSSFGEKVGSIGIDTFGSGYGYLDKMGRLVSTPFHYKDSRTDGIVEDIEKRISAWEIYKSSGVCLRKSNVLAQLFVDVKEDAWMLSEGKDFMPLPCLLFYLLSGVKQTERSIVSEGNLLDGRSGEWNWDLFHKLSIPGNLFMDICDAGTVKASLDHNVVLETGCSDALLVNIIGHDTENALAAAPGFNENKIFLSIGTAIVFGTQTENAVINRKGFDFHFKNVKGMHNRNSLCKDISGFWIVNQCMRVWKKKRRDISFAELCVLAGNSKENKTYINVNDPVFRSNHDDIIECIQDYCKRTGQPVPGTIGEITKCLYESYAICIKYAYECLTEITGRAGYEEAVVINGGVKNAMLMQMIADALEIPVVTGSGMASAMGNILLQLEAHGELKGESEMREVAAKSSVVERYEGQVSSKWKDGLAYMKENGMFDTEQ